MKRRSTKVSSRSVIDSCSLWSNLSHCFPSIEMRTFFISPAASAKKARGDENEVRKTARSVPPRIETSEKELTLSLQEGDLTVPVVRQAADFDLLAAHGGERYVEVRVKVKGVRMEGIGRVREERSKRGGRAKAGYRGRPSEKGSTRINTSMEKEEQQE